MSRLSDGLEAKDKATPGPWYLDIRGACLAIYPESKMDDIQSCRPEDERNIHFSEKGAQYLYPQWSMSKQAQIDATVMVAAPDALDWIAKALPFMKLDLERRRFADYDDGENRAYGDRDIATLTALIAQAEGQEEGKE